MFALAPTFLPELGRKGVRGGGGVGAQGTQINADTSGMPACAISALGTERVPVSGAALS